jgi:hypothetical protein
MLVAHLTQRLLIYHKRVARQDALGVLTFVSSHQTVAVCLVWSHWWREEVVAPAWFRPPKRLPVDDWSKIPTMAPLF